MGFDFSCFPAKIMTSGDLYENDWMKSRWVLGLAVFAVTTISLRSGRTLPTMFPPIILRAAQGERPGPILSGSKLTANTSAIPASARLPAGSQSWERDLPVAVQLPCDRSLAHSLRSCYETRTQPSGHLRQGGFLRLPADQVGQNAGPDSRRNRGMSTRASIWKAIGARESRN